jgi:hypothetical protein
MPKATRQLLHMEDMMASYSIMRFNEYPFSRSRPSHCQIGSLTSEALRLIDGERRDFSSATKNAK